MAAYAADLDRFREVPWGDDPVPASLHTDPDVYAADIHEVFGRAWLPVAHTSELTEPGDYRAFTAGHLRLLVVRGEDGVLRCHHNVCQHRGALLVDDGEGRCKRLKCPYHGFVYDLDGRFLGAPWQRSYGEGSGLPTLQLASLRTETWGGWLWATADDAAPPLAEFLGAELIEELANWPLDACVSVYREAYEVKMGWRVAVEGFIEPVHLPAIHRFTVNPVLDFRRGTMAMHGDHSVMLSPYRRANLYEPDGVLGKQPATLGIEPFPELNALQRSANFTYLLFPMVTLNLMPNQFTTATLWPLGPDRTLLEHRVYARPAQDDAQQAWLDSLGPGYHQLVQEDMQIGESVQRGLDTGALKRVPLGWYERRIRHFQARLAAWHRSPHGR
jgi:phenylpropionate dioxygenase-like ring-hydroxylating dioxygenase large terminal subunit